MAGEDMVAAVAGEICEGTVAVDGVDTFFRRKPGTGVPVVFSHGNPSHSAEWIEFMRRLERPALAIDLPGWGRTRAPRDLDCSMHGLARFLGHALDALGVDRYALVVHDWGALALIEALRAPARVERVVVMNAVPLLVGYRWHRIARWFWRRRGLGELFNLTATKPALRLLSRTTTARRGPMPPEFVDMVWAGWQRGVRRPMLDLYRSADPEALAAAGRGLDALAGPALVAWGVCGPYIPARFGRVYAERLGDSELVELADAGHWPWIDRPDLVDRVTAFLAG